MSLATLFSRSKNAGELAAGWANFLTREMEAAGIETQVKLAVDGVVSLIAPPAVVAQVLRHHYATAPEPGRALRVLIIGSDPLALMDRGAWYAYAPGLAGLPNRIEVGFVCEQPVESNLFTVATGLGLPVATVVSEVHPHEWDLAVWMHPAVELDESEQAVEAAVALFRGNVPVYSCSYNETDALVQNYGLHALGLALSYTGGHPDNQRLTNLSINRFGLSTSELGMHGGWGAVMCRVRKATSILPAGGWKAIKTAMNVAQLESIPDGPWQFGESVAGVAFGTCVPIGLIGNMAVDTVSGFVYAHSSTTNLLNVVGHLWDKALREMPNDPLQRLEWAARVKLCFMHGITREEKQRGATIEILSQAFAGGVVEAGIALARGYEAMGTKESRSRAQAIYREIGCRHPMSAYALGHYSYEAGNAEEAARLFDVSGRMGYVPAMTDYAKLHLGTDTHGSALKLLLHAAGKGDPEANFMCAEQSLMSGLYSEALHQLRKAWAAGHEQALKVAAWVCQEMLAKNVGKRSHIERELKDIHHFERKREQYQEQLRKGIA